MGQFYVSAGLRKMLTDLVKLVDPVPFIAGTTLASITVTVADTTGLVVGQEVVGVGIPANAKIVSIIVNTSIDLTLAATVTDASVVLAAWVPLRSHLSLRLLTVVPAMTPSVAWADVTEANYTGYAAVPATTWPTVLSTADGFSFAAMDCVSFVPTDFVVPNTIVALAFTWETGAGPTINLLAVEILATPVVLAAAGDGLQVTAILGLASDETAGPFSSVLS